MQSLRSSLGIFSKLYSKRWISSSQLVIERTKDKSRFDNRPKKEDLVFGTTLSDHMLMVEWDIKSGWGAPRIVPYQNLSLSPAAASLHYSSQCFEGMKAYRSLTDESLRLFRPDKNMERLSNSMERLHMPGADFDRTELTKCIAELVKVDQEWIPSGEGYSLYIRPTCIATNPFLVLATPESLLMYVITSPVGPYYKSGFKPVKLTADTKFVRAWPGGTGNSKVGGNYAPTMKAAAEATESGYSQVLWLFGDNDEVTEVGSMNLFFVMINKESKKLELVTPPLTRDDILPGVTRDSILHLARTWEDCIVSERFPTMAEIQEAAEEKRLLEAFGAGTAAVVSPISCIQYQGKDIEIPAVGEVTQRVWNEITGIQYGKVEGPQGWSVKI
eukprot:scaffold22620_cov131-Cylindrotheca_fusiformis.AAC.30